MSDAFLNAVPRLAVIVAMAVLTAPAFMMMFRNRPPLMRSGMLWVSLGLAVHLAFALPNEIKWFFSALYNNLPFDERVALIKAGMAAGYGVIAYGCWLLLHERRKKRRPRGGRRK